MMAEDGSETHGSDEEPLEQRPRDPTISIRATAPSGRPVSHRGSGAHEPVPRTIRIEPARRDTQPVDRVERVEEYRKSKKRHSTDKIHRKRSRHTGISGAPQLIIEEKSRAARKSDFDQVPERASEIPNPHISFIQPLRRRTSRRYPETPSHQLHKRPAADQSSHEMLDDYYDGFDDTLLPDTTKQGLNQTFGSGYEPMFFEPPPPPPRPPPRPPQGPLFPDDLPPDNFPSRPPYSHPLPGPRRKRNDYYRRAPHRTAIWDRAAVWNPKVDTYDIVLKLVLTRHGERYSGEDFTYRKGTWTDIAFARKLNQKYRSLKTAKVGIVQKLTAYKKISFVYFVQFHAFPDSRYPKTGAWLQTDRQPIAPKDNAMTRNSFMNQLRRMCRKKSILYNTLTGTPNDRDEWQSTRWVSRLDRLIEPGAVIDIDVKETFDSSKIYMGLMFAIIVSLGAAVGYGFAMDNDFSTGFSIASWLITALGFLAAVIAAGEYFGLDSPKATLMEVDGYDRPYR
ncbi:hypothetical protein BST61_g6452 [Cercospora zeina]